MDGFGRVSAGDLRLAAGRARGCVVLDAGQLEDGGLCELAAKARVVAAALAEVSVVAESGGLAGSRAVDVREGAVEVVQERADVRKERHDSDR